MPKTKFENIVFTLFMSFSPFLFGFTLITVTVSKPPLMNGRATQSHIILLYSV